ncbi:MAG: hypothetical protein H0V53_03185 [Rubrobacter sp.]|jgi:hypothetical protein|nr:hypothetical protein [Rubrobacter sp.]
MTLLFLLLALVPLAVGAAGLVTFLLQRAGYGAAVWALLPLLGLLAFVTVLGAILGRMAGGNAGERSADGEEPRREDD